jgi:hypothetical protein
MVNTMGPADPSDPVFADELGHLGVDDEDQDHKQAGEMEEKQDEGRPSRPLRLAAPRPTGTTNPDQTPRPRWASQRRHLTVGRASPGV